MGHGTILLLATMLVVTCSTREGRAPAAGEQVGGGAAGRNADSEVAAGGSPAGDRPPASVRYLTWCTNPRMRYCLPEP
jgi:hypothetical protein